MTAIASTLPLPNDTEAVFLFFVPVLLDFLFAPLTIERMNLIVTALRPEAVPFIQRLRLKRVLSITSHEVYRHRDFCLIITGAGLTRAAIGTAVALQFLAHENITCDTVTNIGVAGSNGDFELGALVRATKITNETTKESFYPDVTVNIPCASGFLKSSPIPIEAPTLWEPQTLGDMEGVAFFEACKTLLPIEKVLVLKVVSDLFAPTEITKSSIQAHIEANAERVIEAIRTVQAAIQSSSRTLLTGEDEALLSQCEEHLSLTTSQKIKLREEATYFRASTEEPLPLSALLLNPQPSTKVAQKRLVQEAFDVLSR